MKLPGARRALPPVIIAAVLAGAYGIVTQVKPVTVGTGRLESPPRSAPVASVVRACPSPGAENSAGVAVIAAPATAGSGRALVSRLQDPSGSPLSTVARTGRLSVTRVGVTHAGHQAAAPSGASPSIKSEAGAGGVVISASGSMARGLEAEQFTGGSVPSARCDAPGTDFWFVGSGEQGGVKISLTLMNVSSQAADVSVTMSTDAGPLQGSTDTGIAVAPHSMVVQSLTRVLHSSRAVAINVRTSVGQVVAAVEETKGSARDGVWLPRAGAPATKVILPGLPGTSGTRNLFVAVPGTRNARIHLTAVSTRGSYEPTGGSSLDIPGGSAIEITLPSLAGIPAAIKVSSNVPVTASARLPGGPAGAPGVFTAASGAIQEQGLVADNTGRGGDTSQLVLSAPGHAAKARVSRIGADGAFAKGSRVVRVKAGHSTVVQLKKGHGSAEAVFSVVVTPLAGSGPLYAGRAVEGSGAGAPLQALLPVPSALTTVPLPLVQQTFITARP